MRVRGDPGPENFYTINLTEFIEALADTPAPWPVTIDFVIVGGRLRLGRSALVNYPFTAL